MSSDIQNLREENQFLRNRIQDFQKQTLNANNIDGEIKKFIQESEKNIKEMTDKVSQENAQMNLKLQELTAKYESTLKNQIGLLTKNKELNKRKEEQDEKFNGKIESITANYEQKIKEFEKKVKTNVKKIKQMGETNVIKKLLQSEKFRAEMENRGVKIEVLEKQSELEEVIAAVEEKEIEIGELEARSAGLDEELLKTRELIETMKELLENMVKEKENIVKQNAILKEKLRQSEELIGKLLGSAGAEDGEEEYEEDFENEDGEEQKEEAQEQQ